MNEYLTFLTDLTLAMSITIELQLCAINPGPKYPGWELGGWLMDRVKDLEGSAFRNNVFRILYGLAYNQFNPGP